VALSPSFCLLVMTTPKSSSAILPAVNAVFSVAFSVVTKAPRWYRTAPAAAPPASTTGQPVRNSINGEISDIKIDAKGIYLDNTKRDWESEQRMKEAQRYSEKWQKKQERMARRRTKKVAATAT